MYRKEGNRRIYPILGRSDDVVPLLNDDRDGLRRCRDCDEWKPLDEFHASSRRPSGRGSYCKPCFNVRWKASARKWAGAEGRVIRELHHGRTRNYHLKRRYGIGVEEFAQLLAGQGGVCAICGAQDPEHVDHDHVYGNVRGILCFNCNGDLGQFKDRLTCCRTRSAT
ncbi:MAG: endonuclease domain-containing protein [Micromonosporaceae bacterium]